jgi:glycosyltransferase involved in cell wall biosynthesis
LHAPLDIQDVRERDRNDGSPVRSVVMRPRVSVLISTLGRPSVEEAIRTVLASEAIEIELIVVDQSPDATTASLVADLVDDERLVIIHTATMGVSRGRNLGLHRASNDIVLITDDDVTVPVDWARRFHAAVEALEQVAVAFCRVDAGPHDRDLGFIPDHEVEERVVIRSLLSKSRARGIGAGMAVRRDDVLSIGGFDEQLGPGGRLRSGEDRDLAARALASGWWVLQIPDAFVVHHGFRTWAQGRSLTRRDWYGIGAAYAKQLKCGNLGIVPVIAHEVLWFGLMKPVAGFLVGRRRNGLRRIGYFVSGFVAGLRTAVDAKRMLYVDETTAV